MASALLPLRKGVTSLLRGTGEGRVFGHLQHGIEMKAVLSREAVEEGARLRGV